MGSSAGFRALGGGRAGGAEAASGPCEGALFPRGRAWLTEQCIRRRAGGARGTQQSHSPARAPGPAAGGRRGRGEGRGCRRLLPHSPGQRRPAGRRRLRLAAGRGTPFTLLMSPSAAGEVCAQPGRLRAAPRGSSCPAQGLGGRTSGRQRGGKKRKRPRKNAQS